MIDISVTDLVKSFDLEKKILDGISFQVDTGERVGLLGKNGAGKTTLFNILTGDLDYDSGEVLIAPGRRVGLISQIPVYPAGYTVEDVLRSAFQRTTALKEEIRCRFHTPAFQIPPCLAFSCPRGNILRPPSARG